MRIIRVLFRFCLFIFVPLLFITGCQKTAIQYGQQYIDNGITKIVLVDSISPVVSTIYKDSVPTSGGPNLLVGHYPDPYLGKTSSDAYVQLAPPTLADVLNNAQFDSLVLLMKCNGLFYGDTTLPITLSVSQLTQELKFAETQVGFFNINTFPLNPTPLGARTLVLRPLTGDSANIRLSDSKGQELFNLIRNKDNIVKDNSQFTDYLKGLNISATSNNNLYSFKDSVVMRLYYHQTDVGPENKYFDFAFANSSLTFNHIYADRSGTPLTALNTVNNQLLSTDAGNIGYLQSATGIYLKIGFPTIRNLLQRPDFVKIIRADLLVKPLQNSYNGFYPMPAQLYAAQTDGGNLPGATLTSSSGATSGVETGNLFIDAVYGSNTSYSYDVTAYLTQEIAIALNNQDGLLLLPPPSSRYSSLNRVVVGDVGNQNSRLQLNIYYISVNK